MGGLGRREFLASAGALGAVGWLRLDPVSASEPGACSAPPELPQGILVAKERFESWAGEIVVDDLWTAHASAPRDVVRLANWARRTGWTIRARGRMHSWAPLTVTAQQGCDRVLLVDAKALDQLSIERGGLVRAGAGVTLGRLLAFLEEHGKGLTSVPAVGEITLGGALAIGGHGAAVPAVGEVGPAGDGYGSLSNQVVGITAVAWEPSRGAYALRRFGRARPEASALAMHLGRAFLTEVVLRVGPAQPLRCESIFDRPATAVFAPPARAGRHSFSSLLDRAGRVESIWFPFTERPWTKVWSVAPTKPATSRQTTGPYNYPVTDNVPHEVALLADRIVVGEDEVTPLFSQTLVAVAEASVVGLRATDLWGPAHHTQLYIKATTLRYAELGLAIRTRRRDVQRVVHDIATRWADTVDAEGRAGRYPVNGPLEIRASGLDLPDVSGVRGAQAPLLAPLRPHADHPDLDTMVWVNVLTFPGTAGAHRYLTDLERWARRTFVPPLGRLRAEWSKGWAYSPRGPWTDDGAITTAIPDDYRGASVGPDDWDEARRLLNALDPHRVFTNPFLDRLLP